MNFVQESELEGLTVFEFEQVIEPTKIAELDVPGDLIGSDEASVQVDRFYSNVRHVWVEPLSGVIVRGTENQLSTLRDGGEDVLTITEVDLAFSDAGDIRRPLMQPAQQPLVDHGPHPAQLLGLAPGGELARCVHHLVVRRDLVPDGVEALVAQARARQHRGVPQGGGRGHQVQGGGVVVRGVAGPGHVVALGLVHRHQVGELEDALLDALQLVAGARPA